MRWRRRRTPPGAPPAEPPPPADPVTARLDERRGRLEAELLAAAGGESLCAISKAAGSVPAAKYLEGRLSALSELRRARPGPDVAACAARIGTGWHQRLDALTTRGVGPDWLAYLAGGVDELDRWAEAADDAPSAH